MAKMPAPRSTTRDKVLKLYEDREDAKPIRGHLGASQIGKDCERQIWATWRWHKPEAFEGRLLRLFESGFREEDRVKRNLRDIGVEVFDAAPGTALQFAFSDGHFQGSVDGVLLGLPEAPKTPHLLEVKTANDRRFKELQKKGVREARPDHYAQMQVYMDKMKLTRALYWTTNKNSDDLHLERIEFNKAAAERYAERAKRIVEAEEPPARISDDPKAFACKWCNLAEHCHQGAIPEANCRTCAHSTAHTKGEQNGEWSCAIDRDAIVDNPRAGCGGHLYAPPLIPAKAVGGGDGFVKYQTDKGVTFINCSDVGFPADELGDDDIALYASAELQHMNLAAIDTGYAGKVKKILGGKVVGGSVRP